MTGFISLAHILCSQITCWSSFTIQAVSIQKLLTS